VRIKLTNQKERINVVEEIVRKAEQAHPDLDARIAMIQMLIPLGLEAVHDMLQEEVLRLAGDRHSREGSFTRWGKNPGSVFLGDQKVKISVPRLRTPAGEEEVPLETYRKFQNPGFIDKAVLARVINGLRQGKYEEAALSVPETFGIKKNSVSRRFIKASGWKLRRFMERDLTPYDIVAIVIDGKTFAENQIVVALGVTFSGEKMILGFIEANTENHAICRDFLNRLIDRGLNTANEILFIIDGGKGIRKGILDVVGEKAFIQRCQWHKRENVLHYLDKDKQEFYRKKLQAAYEQPTYQEAKRRLEGIKRELRFINISAVHSLEEGMEETLTLHKLGVFKKLGVSFKTTNCIEHVNRQLELYTSRVNYWKSSDHRHRWIATALLELEPTLRKVKGCEFLPALRAAMRLENESKNQIEIRKAA
jgi:transposase-like protein